jgi:hypothetical protein
MTRVDEIRAQIAKLEAERGYVYFCAWHSQRMKQAVERLCLFLLVFKTPA